MALQGPPDLEPCLIEFCRERARARARERERARERASERARECRMCWLSCNALPSLAGSSPSFQKFCADVLKKDDSPCTITRPCGGSYPCVARASSRGHAAGAKSRMHITTREHGDPDLVLGEFDTHSKINGRSATLRDGQGKLPFRSIVERRNFHLGLRDGRADPAPA